LDDWILAIFWEQEVVFIADPSISYGKSKLLPFTGCFSYMCSALGRRGVIAVNE
jgi:hypothetical protein